MANGARNGAVTNVDSIVNIFTSVIARPRDINVVFMNTRTRAYGLTGLLAVRLTFMSLHSITLGIWSALSISACHQCSVPERKPREQPDGATRLRAAAIKRNHWRRFDSRSIRHSFVRNNGFHKFFPFKNLYSLGLNWRRYRLFIRASALRERGKNKRDKMSREIQSHFVK